MNFYKFLYFLLLILFIMSCSKSFKAISVEVEKKQRIGTSNLSGWTFHDIRIKLYREGKLHFLKDADVVCMLESYNVEEAAFYGKIWTTKDSVEYMYRNNGFSFNAQTPFTKYMSQLISQWDTLAIRKNEELYSNIIPTQSVYGTKIMNYKDKPEIFTIRFARFFNADRDRFGSP